MIKKRELEDYAHQTIYKHMTDARLLYDLIIGGRSDGHAFITWYEALVQCIWADICQDEVNK